MNLFNYDFMNDKNEDRDYINDLIYENIDLTNNNIKLEFENKMLRERIEVLKGINKKNSEKTSHKSNVNYVVVYVGKLRD